MKKCDKCIIGSGLECYYDYGGEEFIFEDCIEHGFIELRKYDCLSLFNFCPECGHKNNLKRFQAFLDEPLENYLFSGKVL